MSAWSRVPDSTRYFKDYLLEKLIIFSYSSQKKSKGFVELFAKIPSNGLIIYPFNFILIISFNLSHGSQTKSFPNLRQVQEYQESQQHLIPSWSCSPRHNFSPWRRIKAHRIIYRSWSSHWNPSRKIKACCFGLLLIQIPKSSINCPLQEVGQWIRKKTQDYSLARCCP